MTRAGALCTETSGGGSLAITMLHGWSLNLRVFDGLRELLGDVARCTALDLPGHGRSAPIHDPTDRARSAQSARWTAATVLPTIEAALQPHDSVLLGWSLGGQLALQLAATAPARCRALILVATNARFVAIDDKSPGGMPPAAASDFRRRLLADVRQAQADFLELQVRGAQQSAGSLKLLRHALASHGASDADTLTASLDYLYGNDLRSLLASVSMPTLVIAGQYDRITHPETCKVMARSLPNARYFAVPRAGHAPFLSHPVVVADAIREFLASSVV